MDEKLQGLLLAVVGFFLILVVAPLASLTVLPLASSGCRIIVASSIGDLPVLVAGGVVLALTSPRIYEWRAKPRTLALLVLASLAITIASSIALASYMRRTLITRIALACWPKAPWLMILMMLVISPVSEEICFRGLIQHGLSRAIGAGKALVVAALAFGLMHVISLGPLGALIAFIQGLVLGAPILLWDSLPASILLHVVANLPGVLSLILGLA